MDSAPLVQTIIAAGLPTLSVLIGILINNSRLTGLRGHIDTRFEDLKAIWSAELHRVEEVMDARLKHLEDLAS